MYELYTNLPSSEMTKVGITGFALLSGFICSSCFCRWLQVTVYRYIFFHQPIEIDYYDNIYECPTRMSTFPLLIRSTHTVHMNP